MERIDESVYDRADEGLLRLIEKAKVSALSEEEHKLYDASMKLLEDEIDMEEHGFKRGKAEGLNEGIAQGRAEGISDVVRKMVQHNMPIDEIILFSGLSKEEIEALK